MENFIFPIRSTGSFLPVETIDTNPEGLRGVNDKLIAVKATMQAPIVTPDFNLNRAAEIQGARVLNVTLLANALRPVVILGQERHVYIRQEGMSGTSLLR